MLFAEYKLHNCLLCSCIKRECFDTLLVLHPNTPCLRSDVPAALCTLWLCVHVGWDPATSAMRVTLKGIELLAILGKQVSMPSTGTRCCCRMQAGCTVQLPADVSLQPLKHHVLLLQAAAQAAFGYQASGAAASSNLPQRGVLLQQQLWSARPWLSSSIRAFAASAKPVGAAQTAAQAAKKPAASPGSFSRWWQAFQQVPTVPKFLGLTGVSPDDAHCTPTYVRVQCAEQLPILPCMQQL